MMKKISLLIVLMMTGLAVFSQQDCGSVTDYDGNVYKTVQLGNQCWMAENLRTTHFADGTPLQLAENTESLNRYFYPDGKAEYMTKYGLLYSWYTIMRDNKPSEEVPSGIQSICPDGWHLPSNFEWMGLEDFLGYKDEYRCGTDVNNVAKCLAAKDSWKTVTPTVGLSLGASSESVQPCCIAEDLTTNNASGMNVLPAGNFFNVSSGFGSDSGFWTASDGSDISSPIHHFYYANAVVEINCTPKEAAYSVRCLRDN